MATSLTNNLLMFDSGGIKDIRNDLGICFPMSINYSKTFTWSSASTNTTITVSGNPGTIFTAAMRGSTGNTFRFTSNGGTWYWYNTGNNKVIGNGTPADITLQLKGYPWVSWDSEYHIGPINYSFTLGTGGEGDRLYSLQGIIAYRLY